MPDVPVHASLSALLLLLPFAWLWWRSIARRYTAEASLANALAVGSLCGIKSLFVNMLIAVQIPRALELFSYLGPSYIVIVGENDYEYGYINVPLDGRCRIPEA